MRLDQDLTCVALHLRIVQVVKLTIRLLDLPSSYLYAAYIGVTLGLCGVYIGLYRGWGYIGIMENTLERISLLSAKQQSKELSTFHAKLVLPASDDRHEKLNRA